MAWMNKDNWCLHINIIVNINEKSIKINRKRFVTFKEKFRHLVKQRIWTRHFLQNQKLVNSKGFCFLFSNFCSCTEKLFCSCFQKAVWYSFHFCFWEIEKTEKLFGTVFIFVFKKNEKNENYLVHLLKKWKKWKLFGIPFEKMKKWKLFDGDGEARWCRIFFLFFQVLCAGEEKEERREEIFFQKHILFVFSFLYFFTKLQKILKNFSENTFYLFSVFFTFLQNNFKIFWKFFLKN